MKTVILNGSPRKQGETSVILSALCERLQGEVIQINTYSARVSPCVDCRYCWSHAACAIEDDMQNIYRQLDRADNIVLASPVYFGELTGSLLNFASRLQFFWTAEKFRKQPFLQNKIRKGAVILVGGGEDCPEQALAMGRRLLGIMGAEVWQEICYFGTDRKEREDPLKDPALLEAVQELADRFAVNAPIKRP